MWNRTLTLQIRHFYTAVAPFWFFSSESKVNLATKHPDRQTRCPYSGWRRCSSCDPLLLGFSSRSPASGKWLPSSDPSGFRRQRGFWDFEFRSPRSKVLLIRQHEPETDGWMDGSIPRLNDPLLCGSLPLTSRSASLCRLQRWCCRDSLRARYKPPSTDGPTSPERQTRGT